MGKASLEKEKLKAREAHIVPKEEVVKEDLAGNVAGRTFSENAHRKAKGKGKMSHTRPHGHRGARDPSLAHLPSSGALGCPCLVGREKAKAFMGSRMTKNTGDKNSYCMDNRVDYQANFNGNSEQQPLGNLQFGGWIAQINQVEPHGVARDEHKGESEAWKQIKKNKKQAKVKFVPSTDFHEAIHNAKSYRTLCSALAVDSETEEQFSVPSHVPRAVRSPKKKKSKTSMNRKASKRSSTDNFPPDMIDSDSEDEVDEKNKYASAKELPENDDDEDSDQEEPSTRNIREIIARCSKRQDSLKICPVTIASVTGEEFQQKAQQPRDRCVAERREAEAAETASRGSLMNMINTAMGQRKKKSGGWKQISVAIDSGAAETVIPHTLVPEHEIMEIEKSKAGLCYASATGEPIPNMGEQQLPMVTCEGSLRKMTFQAAPVAKALGSVSKICAAGHAVVFDADYSFIMNKATGEINWLREEQGNYMLDVWVPPPTDDDEGFGGLP